MLRKNSTQMNSFAAAVVVAAVISVPGAVRAQGNPEKDVERVIRDFLVAFSNRDFAVFVPYFSEDATVFFPPSTAAPLGPSSHGPPAARKSGSLPAAGDRERHSGPIDPG